MTTLTAPSTTADSTRTDRLLTAGVVAGPVLGLTWLAQGLVREGYDFTRHPMSLLALGEGGWLKAMRLEGYAPRRPRGPLALQQALFPYAEAL